MGTPYLFGGTSNRPSGVITRPISETTTGACAIACGSRRIRSGENDREI
jgi:hypothetical protein